MLKNPLSLFFFFLLSSFAAAGDPISAQKLDEEWNAYGMGLKKVERGMFYMRESPGSQGFMIVSPEAYGKDVTVTYEIMPMTAASVCVVILSASDSDGTGTDVTLPENYDGSMGHWIQKIDNLFFAFHNPAHNRFPFAIRFPEGRLLAEYSDNVMMTGKFHRVEASIQGGNVKLIVDGETLVEARDSNPPGPGHVAFRIRGLSEEPAACLIRNVSIDSRED